MLEGSKDFSKEFMFKHSIPTAQYKTFNTKNLNDGLSLLREYKTSLRFKGGWSSCRQRVFNIVRA